MPVTLAQPDNEKTSEGHKWVRQREAHEIKIGIKIEIGFFLCVCVWCKIVPVCTQLCRATASLVGRAHTLWWGAFHAPFRAENGWKVAFVRTNCA